jgi:histone acetyltransferase (RNA polymerase elongator complex component)
MKKIDLKRIIKEEIQNIMNESSSKTLRDLSLDDAIEDTIYLPASDEGLSTIRTIVLGKPNNSAQRDLDYAREVLVNKFGPDILEAPIIIDANQPWFKRFVIKYKPLELAREKYSNVKGSWLDDNM